MGACTFTRGPSAAPFGFSSRGDQVEGTYNEYRVVRGLLTMSTSYATGGDTLPLGGIGLKEIHKLLIDTSMGAHISGMSIGILATDPAAPKIQAFDAFGVEVANATNLSTRGTTPVWFLGY